MEFANLGDLRNPWFHASSGALREQPGLPVTAENWHVPFLLKMVYFAPARDGSGGEILPK